MKLCRLYIENFMCHENSFIDFLEFNSALIVGKIENNDLFSNGVGKSTIFKAIEYGLFNQADVNLEKIIRDDAASCKITIDFFVLSKEYRLVRTRNKKNGTDISIYERNDVVGDIETVYHKNNIPVVDKKFWKDISGRRAADTEKDLLKLIKINFKSFRSTVHFIQNDFSGLATTTPEKRKAILKEALNLSIYSKLEKIAKEQSNLLSKDIDKHNVLIESLKDPDVELFSLKEKLLSIDSDLLDKQKNVEPLILNLSSLEEELNNLFSKHSTLEANFISLINKEKILSQEIERLDLSIKDYSVKKNNTIKYANEVISELKNLKQEQEDLKNIDFDKINDLEKDIFNKKEILLQFNTEIKILLSKVLDLKQPITTDNICKHCRQTVSPEYRQNCQSEINNEIEFSENKIISIKKNVVSVNAEIVDLQQKINNLNSSKQKLEKISEKISFKNQELLDKKSLHSECVNTLNNLQSEFKNKSNELIDLKNELKNSSQDEAFKIKNEIESQKLKINTLKTQISFSNKEITHLNNTKAVINHNIEQKNKDLLKKQELFNNLNILNDKYHIYPSVLQAFSSTGIPNLFIQNVLDDLQIEANQLLNQLKPGLQLSFFVEKTKNDGTDADTLDILYHINGKERQYDQLSGAQKLAVTFSLKLGLSFLLQKMVGTDLKFLLLDEIDQSLDKAGVDAFADIVKFFQKDFTILVITHNDRLKDKFSHAILVEQDINMVSRAKVVSSW